MKYILQVFLSFIFLLVFPLSLQDKDIELTKSFTVPQSISAEETILKNMTNEEKVGQFFIFGIQGTTLTKEEEKFLTDNHIGGIILMGENISDKEQLKNLISDIQSTNKIPLFISIDQEGGVVSRITWDDILTKGQKDIQDYNDSYITARKRGEYLKELGINMNLAPVVEYITDEKSFIYNRTYKGNEKEVILKSVGAVRGYTDAKIISVIKHYPGHANQSADSHYFLPVVEITEKEWNEYTQPFNEIIKKTRVDALMTGHIMFPNIDTSPSSLSYKILTKKLKQDTGYTDLVITDDINMEALKEEGSIEEIAFKALYAGNDIIIYCPWQIPLKQNIYNYILEKVNNGDINIDSKVLKILRTKIKYDILNP